MDKINMVDIIFYNGRLGTQNVITGYKNIMNVPDVNEPVMVEGNVYSVKNRLFDFDMNTVHIVVEPSKKRFVRG